MKDLCLSAMELELKFIEIIICDFVKFKGMCADRFKGCFMKFFYS